MLVVEHPRLSQALAGATVVIQLGAVALVLSARLRLVSAALLLAFHVNVALLTGIYYSGNMLLLVAFGCPWARWLGLRRGDAPEHLRKPDADAVATLLCRSLDERPLFVRLLAILHALLEQNLAPESTLRFKRTLLHRVGTTAFRLESALPFLSPGGGSELLLTLHAMVVGFRQMADPSPVVAQVLALDEMAPLRTDFASSIERALRALLLGMSHRSRTRRNP